MRSVILKAIKINIIREMLRSRFRDDIWKVRPGCLAVVSSILDLKPGRVEQSYTTVVETSVANYQSTRRDVSKDFSFYLNKTLLSKCRFSISLQVKVIGLIHPGLRIRNPGSPRV